MQPRRLSCRIRTRKRTADVVQCFRSSTDFHGRGHGRNVLGCLGAIGFRTSFLDNGVELQDLPVDISLVAVGPVPAYDLL
jgi:hypothetical protein